MCLVTVLNMASSIVSHEVRMTSQSSVSFFKKNTDYLTSYELMLHVTETILKCFLQAYAVILM